MTTAIPTPPDPDRQKLLALFETLKQLPAIAPLQFTAHEVAMERCRLAVEWQSAISEAAVLLFERADALLKTINRAAQTVLKNAEAKLPISHAEGWGELTREAEALLHTTGQYHQVSDKLRTCLVQLGTQIHVLEGLSSQVALLTEKVEKSQKRIAALLT